MEPETEINTFSTPNYNAFGNDSDSDEDNYCRYLLYVNIGKSRIRYWDLVVLIPNILFVIFLCYRFKRARLKLYATNSPIYLTFYFFVWICVGLSLLKTIVSMLMDALQADYKAVSMTDKILSSVVVFALMTTELSVLIFGMAFGHLDSRNSIKFVLITTCSISLVFSITQVTLELLLPTDPFHVAPKNLDLFGHGGVLFVLISAILFTITYLAIFLLPFTRVRNLILLPVKRSFYNYILILTLVSCTIVVGCSLLLSNVPFADYGLCLINVVNLLYYTLYIPLVYLIFLNELFGSQPTKIPFSYANSEAHNDDNLNSIDSTNNTMVDDQEYPFNRNHDHHSNGTNSNNITNFVLNAPLKKDSNPNYQFLYASAIQSPDSITGYSSVEESTATTTPHGSMEFMIPK